MDSEIGSGSSKNLGKDAKDIPNTRDTVGGAQKSVSSSSSDSSVEYLFQVDQKIVPKSSASLTSLPKPPRVVLKYLESNVSSDTSSKSEKPDSWSPGRTSSQVSDITHESSLSPTQYPSIQVMERPGDFDPNRIPSSIFASKSSTPREWSNGSTESLFSIRIGNNSFSKDILMLGGDLYKSEELFKSGEHVFKSGELLKPEEFGSELIFKSDELIRLRRPFPSAGGGEDERECLEAGKKSGERGVSDELVKIVPNEKDSITDLGEAKVPSLGGSCDSACVNRCSDGSGTNNQSFAFPVKKKSAWPFWNSCFKCSWTFCFCTWPSCSCKWLSCSCKWPSCCCKWPSWPSCCFRWPSCSCKCPSWPSCCSCKWPSCCSCKWPSWPSFCRCNWPSWPSCCSCKCPSWPSCCSRKCPSWRSYKWHCSNCCSWAFCCCWNCRPKRPWSSPPETLVDGGIKTPGNGSSEKQFLKSPGLEKPPKQASKKRWCSFPHCSCSFWRFC